MPADTDQPTLAVTQADREAAAAYLFAVKGYDVGKAIREGRSDHTVTVQAFARHRTNSEPRPAGDLREALVAGVLAISGTTLTFEADNRADVETVFDALATHSSAPMAGEGEVREALAAFVKQASVGKPGRPVTRSKYVSAPAGVYNRAVAVLADHPPTQEGSK